LLHCNVILKNEIIKKSNKKGINKYNKPCLFRKITDSNKVEIKVLVDVNSDIKKNKIYLAEINSLVLVDFKCFIYYLKQNNIKSDEEINKVFIDNKPYCDNYKLISDKSNYKIYNFGEGNEEESDSLSFESNEDDDDFIVYNNFIDKTDIKIDKEDFHVRKEKIMKEGNFFLITSMIEKLQENLIDNDDLGESKVKEIILSTLREFDEDLDNKVEKNEKERKKKLNKKKLEINLKEKEELINKKRVILSFIIELNVMIRNGISSSIILGYLYNKFRGSFEREVFLKIYNAITNIK